MRDGGLGRHRPFHAHAHRHPGIAADGAIDPAGRPQPAMRQGDIFASHAAGLQLSYQMGLGGFIAGHDHQSDVSLSSRCTMPARATWASSG